MPHCSKEAFAKCSTRHLCGSPEEATFAENSECAKFNALVAEQPLSNGDRIRCMSDGELAKVIHKLWRFYAERGEDFSKNWCDGKNKKTGLECYDCDPKKHRACIHWWLQQPVRSDDWFV